MAADGHALDTVEAAESIEPRLLSLLQRFDGRSDSAPPGEYGPALANGHRDAHSECEESGE